MIKLENVKSPFMCYCAKVIPLAFDESMSYYECLCNFYNYLKNEIMPAINNNAEATSELQDLFIELQNYVDNYFENLNVQEEINNKLDDMAEHGELADIIAQYIQLQYIKIFDTVSDMKLAENLTNGDTVMTNGYYNLNDGGSAKYKVRNVTSDDTIDEMFIIALNDNSIIAELIVKDELNIKQIGVKGILSSNDTDKIKTACTKNYNVYFPEGDYLLDEQVNFTNATDKIIRGDGINKTNFILDSNITGTFTSYLAISDEEDASNFTFKDISLNCDNQNVNRYGISFLNVNGLNIKNIEIKNNKGYATRLNDCNNINISNIIIDNCKEPVQADGVAGGIYGQNMTNLHVENARITNCGDHAFYITGDNALSGTTEAKNIQLNNIYCNTIGTDGWTNGGAINIYGNTKNVNITNAIIEESAQGIHISDHGTTLLTPKDINISNCIIKNTNETAIFIQGLSDSPVNSVNISNSTIDTTLTNDGISLRRSENITLSNNIIKNCKRIGIEVINTDSSIINSNLLMNNVSQLWIGTRSSTHADNNIISNNTIFTTDDFNTNNPTNSGIYVTTDATKTLVSNNNAYNHMQYNYLVLGETNKSILQSMNNRDTNYKRSIMYNNAMPSANINAQAGDICLNINPSAGGTIGWVCVTAGSPGTWKPFGSINS